MGGDTSSARLRSIAGIIRDGSVAVFVDKSGEGPTPIDVRVVRGFIETELRRLYRDDFVLLDLSKTRQLGAALELPSVWVGAWPQATLSMVPALRDGDMITIPTRVIDTSLLPGIEETLGDGDWIRVLSFSLNRWLRDPAVRVRLIDRGEAAELLDAVVGVYGPVGAEEYAPADPGAALRLLLTAPLVVRLADGLAALCARDAGIIEVDKVPILFRDDIERRVIPIDVLLGRAGEGAAAPARDVVQMLRGRPASIDEMVREVGGIHVTKIGGIGEVVWISGGWEPLTGLVRRIPATVSDAPALAGVSWRGSVYLTPLDAGIRVSTEGGDLRLRLDDDRGALIGRLHRFLREEFDGSELGAAYDALRSLIEDVAETRQPRFEVSIGLDGAISVEEGFILVRTPSGVMSWSTDEVKRGLIPWAIRRASLRTEAAVARNGDVSGAIATGSCIFTGDGISVRPISPALGLFSVTTEGAEPPSGALWLEDLDAAGILRDLAERGLYEGRSPLSALALADAIARASGHSDEVSIGWLWVRASAALEDDFSAASRIVAVDLGGFTSLAFHEAVASTLRWVPLLTAASPTVVDAPAWLVQWSQDVAIVWAEDTSGASLLWLRSALSTERLMPFSSAEEMYRYTRVAGAVAAPRDAGAAGLELTGPAAVELAAVVGAVAETEDGEIVARVGDVSMYLPEPFQGVIAPTPWALLEYLPDGAAAAAATLSLKF